MSIALYDADMATYIHVPFNLELMKMATYYKKKREIVTLSPVFDPDRFTRLMYRKDYYDGSFDPRLLKCDNVEYGGYAFSNGLYVPMDAAIEKQVADTSIYYKYEGTFGTKRSYKNFFKKLTNCAHVRLSLDGANVQENYTSQIPNEPSRVFFFHDYNVNDIKDSEKVIKEILGSKLARQPRPCVGFKFPIDITDPSDLRRWLDFTPAENAYTIRCHTYIPDELFVELVERTNGTSILRQMEYVFGPPWYEENDFIENWLPKIFKQVIFLQMHKKQISLKYDDYFFQNPKWERLIDFFNEYLRWSIVYNYEKDLTNSLYYFAQSLREFKTEPYQIVRFRKQEARDLFNLVRENNYELFKLFYECSRVKLVGGKFE